MPETGHSWRRIFPATPDQARDARAWVASRLDHPDAQQIAGELFVTMLASRPAAIEMTVSTAGRRVRIGASGGTQLPAPADHGLSTTPLRGLAPLCGTTPDDSGFWAEITQEDP